MVVTDRRIEAWLREDLGHRDAINDVPGETTGDLVAGEPGIAAGLDAARRAFEYFDVAAEARVGAGDSVEAGDTVLRASGDAAGVLRAERVAANVAGHCSGIATETRRAVDAVREVSDDVEVAGTRKTTPGLRGAEKRAVAAGGGDTHRLDLSHMALIKDNHIAELGLETAIERFEERTSFATKLEVEVKSPEDGRRAADLGADVVLFDNLAPGEVERGVERLPESTLSEASGGVTLETVREYAATGVDVVSMGALTHSAPALEYSFRTG